jgi:hypothetical protein
MGMTTICIPMAPFRLPGQHISIGNVTTRIGRHKILFRAVGYNTLASLVVVDLIQCSSEEDLFLDSPSYFLDC